LFDVTSLVKDHLGKCLQVCSFLNLKLIALGQGLELIVLLLDDLLVLELDQFALLLEVTNDLVKAAFKQVDLRLQLLDFLVLAILLLGSLHILAHLALQLGLEVNGVILQVARQALEVLKLLLLDQGLVLQPLILGLDVALNFRDVFLCLSLSLGVLLLEFEVETVLDLLRLIVLLHDAVALDHIQLVE
jgi:hypothetical protein